MANSINGFYQTVVSALGDSVKLLTPTHNASKAIFWDFQPDQTGVLGQTINAVIPADPTSAVADAGVGDMVLTDISFSTTPIVFNKHPQFGYVVRDFEQFNSPDQVRNVFLDAGIKGIMNNINAAVTALLVAGNFTPTAIATTGGVITVPQFLAGRAVLADNYVDVNDVGNMSLILASTPANKMMDGTTGGSGAAWTQAFIVGDRTASTIHEAGQVPVAFATQFLLDQQMTTTGSAPTRTFIGALIHRYAVAGVSRALPKPDEKVVECTYIDFGNLSLRVMLGYNQIKGGWVVTIDCGYGLKVVRPTLGQIFSTAE